MFLASIVVFHVNPLFSFPIWALFLLIDGAYLSANLFKFLNGETFYLSNCQTLGMVILHLRVVNMLRQLWASFQLKRCPTSLITVSHKYIKALITCNIFPGASQPCACLPCHGLAPISYEYSSHEGQDGDMSVGVVVLDRWLVPHRIVSCGLRHQRSLVLRAPAQDSVCQGQLKVPGASADARPTIQVGTNPPALHLT